MGEPRKVGRLVLWLGMILMGALYVTVTVSQEEEMASSDVEEQPTVMMETDSQEQEEEVSRVLVHHMKKKSIRTGHVMIAIGVLCMVVVALLPSSQVKVASSVVSKNKKRRHGQKSKVRGD